MIHSMTGFAAVQHVHDGTCYALEIRSLNNRYLKLSIKLPEYLQFLESDMDRLVRDRVARGSVSYSLRVRHEADSGAVPVNVPALQRYVEQLVRVKLPPGVSGTVDLGTLAGLPGVCEMPRVDDEGRRHVLRLVTDLTSRAIDGVIDMRRREGETLQAELSSCCDEINAKLGQIGARAPRVVGEYHQRLKSRVELLMKSSRLELESEGLMREVAIYAERCDIN